MALTPTYASYNKQQLAITKLAIKSVARLTKIAHWAERQFDFQVFFFCLSLGFFLFSFCFFSVCCCCLLVVSGLRLCIRDVPVACRLSTVRHAARARWLRSYSNEMFAPAITSSARTTAFFFVVSLFCCFASFPLHFRFYFLCWLRPEMRKFCMPKAEKIYENYCGNEFASLSLFPFIHFRSSMAIAKNVFQSISLEAAALQPETEPEPEPSCVIIILALFYAHPLAMVAFSPHWICIWFVVFCLSNNNCRFINANVALCRIECDFNSPNFYSASMELSNKNKYQKLSHWISTVVKALIKSDNDSEINSEILFIAMKWAVNFILNPSI